MERRSGRHCRLAANGMSFSFGLKEAGATTATAEQGKWVSVACWHNCGGRCLNKAMLSMALW
jgi:hypothetical protein